jgi:two-component system response regulator HydG
MASSNDRLVLIVLDAPRPTLICLLDDDPSVLRGLNRLLMSVGWHPEQFSDPGTFLEYVKLHRPTVAIIDVWMPLMNGLEVQSRVRELSPTTRVIMFTGKDDPLVRSTSLKAGASAFFTKPFDDEEFLTAVRFALCGM